MQLTWVWALLLLGCDIILALLPGLRHHPVFDCLQFLETIKNWSWKDLEMSYLIISSNQTSSNNSKNFRIYCSTWLPSQPVTYVYLWRHIQPITIEILYTFGWDLICCLYFISVVLLANHVTTNVLKFSQNLEFIFSNDQPLTCNHSVYRRSGNFHVKNNSRKKCSCW